MDTGMRATRFFSSALLLLRGLVVAVGSHHLLRLTAIQLQTVRIVGVRKRL